MSENVRDDFISSGGTRQGQWSSLRGNMFSNARSLFCACFDLTHNTTSPRDQTSSHTANTLDTARTTWRRTPCFWQAYSRFTLDIKPDAEHSPWALMTWTFTLRPREPKLTARAWTPCLPRTDTHAPPHTDSCTPAPRNANANQREVCRRLGIRKEGEKNATTEWQVTSCWLSKIMLIKSLLFIYSIKTLARGNSQKNTAASDRETQQFTWNKVLVKSGAKAIAHAMYILKLQAHGDPDSNRTGIARPHVYSTCLRFTFQLK